MSRCRDLCLPQIGREKKVVSQCGLGDSNEFGAGGDMSFLRPDEHRKIGQQSFRWLALPRTPGRTSVLSHLEKLHWDSKKENNESDL